MARMAAGSGKPGASVVAALDYREFLPAAIEIRDTAPAPLGRALLWGIVLLLILSLTWACLGKVDVVAVAGGRVIPSGRSKIMQALESAVVRSIHVRDGQMVRSGDLLLRFEGEELLARQQRLRGELEAERVALVRAQQVMRLLDAQEIDLPELSSGSRYDADGVLVQLATPDIQMIRAQWQRYFQSREALQRREAVVAAKRRSLEAERERLTLSLPIYAERSAAAETLYTRRAMARQQYLAQELDRVEAEQALIATQADLDAFGEEMSQLRAERVALEASARSESLVSIEQHRRAVAALRQELRGVAQQVRRLELRAPIDGTVQQLALHAPGAVATPAEALMLIVPKDDPLEIEALLLNRDSGFVHPGQMAQIKVETFNFTRYGLIDARVKTVSAEAVEHAQLGLVYPARLELARQTLPVDGREARLVPGMSVQAEISTGRRRIIDYFLSPLARVAQESIRER